MFTLFTICAVFGVVIMICQIVMMAMGLDGVADDAPDIGDIGDDIEMGDEYVDTHQLSTMFFGVLSFRSIIAFIAFFGMGGHIGLSMDLPSVFIFGIALGMGVVAMVIVAWMMKMMYELRSEGNIEIINCIGVVGIVYLKIPGNRSGVGKVTVSVQNRSMEYQAVTAGDELASGARVVVSGISDGSTLEVELDQ